VGNFVGPARNREMVASGADMCVAVHGSLATNKGTNDCARQAIEAGIPTYLIDSADGIPRRMLRDDKRLN
jgi:AhpD family alkylhydroperoxidase